jgi:hypothetical protein
MLRQPMSISFLLSFFGNQRKKLRTRTVLKKKLDIGSKKAYVEIKESETDSGGLAALYPESQDVKSQDVRS